MTEHETNLRDLAAMFALTGLLARNATSVDVTIPVAFELADLFMKQRAEPELIAEDGIAALKPKRRKSNEQD
jgi:hypothetical protein